MWGQCGEEPGAGLLPFWRPSECLVRGLFLSHSGGMDAEDFLGPGRYMALSAWTWLLDFED